MTERSGIQVVVRLRPMSERELKGNTLPVVTASTEKKEVTVIKGSGARTLRSTFAFDDVFTSFSTQKEVFDQTLAPVIGDVLAGYESTVFAYGQTGTGKTHTMEGNLEVSADRGVIPRAAFDVFRRLRADDAYVDFDVRASFLEIYNEELCDLLVDCDLDDIAAVKAKSKELRLVEDSGGPGAPGKKKGRGVFVMGLTEERVESPEDVLTLMARAAERRKVGETKMNKQSSRSHCVFTMSVRSRRVLTDGSHMECAGKLHMVDLAGSECAKSAGGGDGGADAARERERKNINQSLLTLGRVITLLKNGGKAKGERIPYRDSKLTRLLQESLGGRCKTCVIATVSPSAMSADETLSTLQYAQSAHGIVNKPVAASMLKLNVEGLGPGRPATARGDGAGGAGMTGQTQQDWAEMETRMHYLETQAEEAAAALARKHAEHAALVSRAETAEGAVAVAEKAALVSRAETAETLERLLEKTAENERLGVLLAARVRTEEALTAEAKALLAALDAFADAAARKTKALEAEAAAEAEKRKKARAFGASAAASVASLAAAVEETAAELTAAHAAARASAARAAEAATAGAEDAAARVAAAADAAAASAAEMSMSAVADADDAAKRRDKLSTKLSAAAKAASEAALQNARNAAKAADAVLAAFAVGESALESWSAAAEKATRDADAEVREMTAEHEQAVASGVADVNASVDDASAALEEQRALLDAAAGRLAAFAAAADALGASASALEAAKAAHDSERAALAELAAEITARVQKSSAAAAAAAAAAESARAEATTAMEAVTRDASAAAAGFAALKRSASDALGEANEVAEKVSKAARLADVMATARDAARSRSKTLAESVANAGAALANAATSAFAATRGSVAAFVGTRPAVVSSAQVASDAAKRDIDALAADAGATVDAVVGAVAKASEKEKAFAADAETRAAAAAAAASAALRDAADAARAAVAATAETVSGHARETTAAVADAGARHESGMERVSRTRADLASAIETHVREVDQAETPVPPADPVVAPAFSTALTSTPCDAAVLAPCGAGVSVDEPSATNAPSEGLADPADSATEANEADTAPDPRRDAEKNAAVFVSAANDENDAPARATKKSSSVAAMRARKFAGSAKPARPALRDVNH